MAYRDENRTEHAAHADAVPLSQGDRTFLYMSIAFLEPAFARIIREQIVAFAKESGDPVSSLLHAIDAVALPAELITDNLTSIMRRHYGNTQYDREVRFLSTTDESLLHTQIQFITRPGSTEDETNYIIASTKRSESGYDLKKAIVVYKHDGAWHYDEISVGSFSGLLISLDNRFLDERLGNTRVKPIQHVEIRMKRPSLPGTPVDESLAA